MTGGVTFAGMTLAEAIENEAVFRRCISNIISIKDVYIAETHVTKLAFAAVVARRAAVDVRYEVTLSSTHVVNVHAAFDGLKVSDWEFALQYSANTDAEKSAFADVKTESVDNPSYATVTDDDDDDEGFLDFIPGLAGASTALLAVIIGVLLVFCVGGTLLCVVCAGGGAKAPRDRGESIENIDMSGQFGKGTGAKPRFEMT